MNAIVRRNILYIFNYMYMMFIFPVIVIILTYKVEGKNIFCNVAFTIPSHF